MTILIKGARVLTLDDADREHECADVLVKGTKIVAVGPDLVPPSNGSDVEVIDGRGKLVMPGLVNAHFHSSGNFMKGALDDTPLEIFMLYEVPPVTGQLPPPRHNYVRTALGAIEMLKRGVTAVQDDAYHVPDVTREGIDSIMQAYADSGMRAHVSIDQPNVVEYEKYPFLKDLLPEEIRQEMRQAPLRSGDDLIAIYEWFIDRWHGKADGRLRCAVSCSAPQRVTSDYLVSLDKLSREHGLAYYIHVLETKLQRVLGQEKYGKSLIRYLHDQGVLSDRCNIIHSIWVDDDDIQLMAEAGCAVAHQPLCNMKIGSGVMPFRRLRNANIPICLGSDESNTDDSTNMWSVAKAAGLVHKLSDPEYDRWPKAPEILECLIGGAARAMQLSGQVGAIKEGYEADLIMLDLNSLNFTPLNDLKRQLVFCEDGTSTEMTMVAGKIVYRDGKLLTFDEEAIKREVRELMSHYSKEIDAISDSAARLEPYYREMYLRAANYDVGMNRWVV